MMAACTPCVWITGRRGECRNAECYPFFIQRCCTHKMVAREFDMNHDGLRNFVGRFHLGQEATTFYEWLGTFIRSHAGRDCCSRSETTPIEWC